MFGCRGIEKLFIFLCVATLSKAFMIPNDFAKDVPDNGGKIWVVLVAGSNEYFNYRHQADVCHAYQIVSGHGYGPSNA